MSTRIAWHSIHPLPLLGLLLAGSGNAALAAEPPAIPLTIGVPVHGEITSADLLNYSDGSRSKLYSFKAAAGDEVVSFAVSGALRGQLTVYADGQLLAGSSAELGKDDADGNDTTSLVWRAAPGQTYQLAVSGRDARAYGPYQLTSQRLELYRGGSLTPEAHITDLLDRNSREIPLTIQTAGLYQIDMRSDAFDAKLELGGNGLSLRDDDGGDGFNARLLTALQPGEYTLRAEGIGRARGLYTLSVAPYALPEGTQLRNDGALEVNGAELTGVLTNENHYSLDIHTRQLVTIDLRSDMFDSYLVLTGPGLKVENDDGGDSLNARIRAVLEPGSYQLTASATPVTSPRRSSAGLYWLSATGSAVPEGAGVGAALVPGREANATLVEGIPNRHTLTVRRRGNYIIDMRSNEIDSYLRLFFNGEELDKDDDSGNALNARIERELSPGNYIIEASDVDADGGRYQIEVRQR